jgi:mannan endo-1,4-beta-mannosidase
MALDMHAYHSDRRQRRHGLLPEPMDWALRLVLVAALLAACTTSTDGDVGESVPATILLSATDPATFDARELDGQTVAGTIYVVVEAQKSVREIRFHLDDEPEPIEIDTSVPFDLLLDTTRLGDGPHTLTAKAPVGRQSGTREVARAEFIVRNDAPAQEVPPAPPTAERMLFGAWTAGGPWRGMEDTYYDLERRLGAPLDVVHWYVSFSTPWASNQITTASAGGRLPMITWEAYVETLDDIASGRYDDRLRDWGRGAAAYGGTLYMRPFQEMNANFFPWGMDPPSFIAAWRRIVDVFRAEGADNVLWVWAPNANDNPDTAENKLEFYYPGADYVDVLAIDGYNWGTCRTWSRWTSFEQVMADAYTRVAALGHQPIWIAEFGSTEQGGDKGAWIKEALANTTFTRLAGLIYFDEDTGRGCDWNIDSSPESELAFAEALALLRSPDAAVTALGR